jgi:hypothetical protein
MSDHLHIDLRIEIYDQQQMTQDERGELLGALCESVVSAKLSEMGFGANKFFISKSVY